MFTTIAGLFLAVLLGGFDIAAAESTTVLRVCADPDNLPFSSTNPDERGLYLELADRVAAHMGVSVEYFWWASYFGKRTIRNSLLSDRCDAYFGLPYGAGYMEKSLTLTRPFLRVGYVIVAPPALSLSQLDDLKGKTVGVEFRTEPQILLAALDGFDVVTFRSAEAVMEALQRGEVETAFVWGPVAGYYNKTRLGSTFQIVPVAGPGLQWQVAVGVRKDAEPLQTALEQALEHLQPELSRLADKYGFPLALPGLLAAQPEVMPPASSQGQPSPVRANTNPFQGDAAIIPVGKSLFNQHCSHCHSPNAINPEPRTDLRRLKGRYGENMTQVFYTTVTEGRSAKGMPAWAGVLNEEMIWKVLTFLESVQKAP